MEICMSSYPAIAPSQPALLPAQHSNASLQSSLAPAPASPADEIANVALDIIKDLTFFDFKALAAQQKNNFRILQEGGLEVVLNLLNLGEGDPKEYHERLGIATSICPVKYEAYLRLEWIKELLKLKKPENTQKAKELFFAGDYSKLDKDIYTLAFVFRGFFWCRADNVETFRAFCSAFKDTKEPLKKRIGELAEKALQQLDPSVHIKALKLHSEDFLALSSVVGSPKKEIYFDWQVKILNEYQKETISEPYTHEKLKKWRNWKKIFDNINKLFAKTEKRKVCFGELNYEGWLFSKNLQMNRWGSMSGLQVLETAGITYGNLQALHELGKAFIYGCDFMGLDSAYDTSKGLNHLKTAANRGYAPAQFTLGQCCRLGIYGVEQSNVYAASWYQKVIATDPSHAEAHWELACLYWNGKGAAPYQLNASILIAKAADLGEKSALEYVAKNKKYFELVKSAEAGNREAQFSLAYEYFDPQNPKESFVDRNYDIAFSLYEKAAKQGHAVAQNNLAVLLIKNNREKEALEWYHKAAAIGTSPVPLNNLAIKYWYGFGVNRDQVKAVELFSQAAKLDHARAKGHFSQQKGRCDIVKSAQEGDAKSQYELGKIFDPMESYEIDPSENRDDGFKKEESVALVWYEKAANQGMIAAIAKIVLRYNDARCRIPLQDVEKDFSWLQKLVAEKHSLGLFEIGHSFWNGLGTKRDFEQAIESYKKSAAQGCAAAVTYCKKYQEHFEKILAGLKGNPDLQYEISQWFDPDCGEPLVFKADKSAAMFWLEKAADQGHYQAINCLSRYYMYGLGVPADGRKGGYYFDKLVQLSVDKAKAK